MRRLAPGKGNNGATKNLLFGISIIFGLFLCLPSKASALDSCSVNGTYKLSALASIDTGAVDIGVQALGSIILTPPVVCTGLGAVSATVRAKLLGAEEVAVSLRRYLLCRQHRQVHHQ